MAGLMGTDSLSEEEPIFFSFLLESGLLEKERSTFSEEAPVFIYLTPLRVNSFHF